MAATPHTVIYTHGGGRLGNQVVRFAHWMAWVREHAGDIEVVNPSFWPYAEYFATWRDNPACAFPVRPHALDWTARQLRRLDPVWRQRLHWRLQRALHAAGRTWPGWQAVALNDEAIECIDLQSPEFLARVTGSPVTTCSGWRYADWGLLERHQDAVRPFFRPAPECAQKAADFVAGLRGRNDVVLGLLVRQSDYREWDDGRFYFPSTQYATWIRQAVDLYPGKRVAVVVASEEAQDPAHYAGLPVYQASGNPGVGGHWFENWAELALCDLVITAPSTFSATAAFHGGVPIWPVVAADQVMALDQIIADGMVGAARHAVFSRSVK